MFCSFCKKIEYVHECSRRICSNGHIACEDCGEGLEICPECCIIEDFKESLVKFSRLIHIKFDGSVPRLSITEASTSAASSVEDLSAIHPVRSLDQLMDELGAYDDGIKTSDDLRPVVGCFEVISGHNIEQSSMSFSMDDEEERKIMKCFKVCGNLSKLKSSTEGGSMIPLLARSTSCVHLNQHIAHREIQTSATYVVEKDQKSTSTRQATTAGFTRSSDRTSRTLNRFSAGDFGGSSTANLVREIYKNKSFCEDSETAHYTTLTVTSGSSPPDSPPKKGLPSLACRVRFSTSRRADGEITAQMEPLMMFNPPESSDDESSSTDVSRMIPRFPVHCPISNCDELALPSDFCRHVIIDHPSIDVARVPSGQLINLSISTRGNLNAVICHRLFLLTDKIENIGYGASENCLPVALVTAKLSVAKVFDCKTGDKDPSRESFFIWLVGVYKFPIDFSIAVFTYGEDESQPTMIKCMSTSASFMDKPFSPKQVVGNAFALSHLELQRLTGNETRKLSAQILFH